jgi:hypothetical protein
MRSSLTRRGAEEWMVAHQMQVLAASWVVMMAVGMRLMRVAGGAGAGLGLVGGTRSLAQARVVAQASTLGVLLASAGMRSAVRARARVQ